MTDLMAIAGHRHGTEASCRHHHDVSSLAVSRRMVLAGAGAAALVGPALAASLRIVSPRVEPVPARYVRLAS